MDFEPLPLHFEKKLARAIELGANAIEVTGTDSSLALALHLSHLSSRFDAQLVGSPHVTVIAVQIGRAHV